jgi:hypothetical protein
MRADITAAHCGRVAVCDSFLFDIQKEMAMATASEGASAGGRHPNQDIGAQVDAGRPDQGAVFHAHLRKSRRVFTDFDYATVGQYPVIAWR